MGVNTFGFAVEGQARSVVSSEVVGWWKLDPLMLVVNYSLLMSLFCPTTKPTSLRKHSSLIKPGWRAKDQTRK